MRLSGQSATILALMSGTSVDSIDAAICRVRLGDDQRLTSELLHFHEQEISVGMRERIFAAFRDGQQSLSLGCSLNFEIGEAFAAAALTAAEGAGIPMNEIDAIASHGQTLYHIAPHMATQHSTGWVASTLQVGEAAVIAARTGRPVISDFRVADMAVGGNGAPLVPFADFHLFSQAGRGVVVHNLGGIGNCTWLPPSGNAHEVIAFDTGPANMIIDALTAHFYPAEWYDKNGAHAAAGKVLPALLDKWMRIPYIAAPPPKSTGRELFGTQFVDEALRENPGARPDDLISTATEFTVLSLADNLRRHVMPRGKIDCLLLAGGGALNAEMTRRFRDKLGTEIAVIEPLDAGNYPVTSKSRECVGFALMGFAHLKGMPANLPSVTGARKPVVLGSYTPAL